MPGVPSRYRETHILPQVASVHCHWYLYSISYECLVYARVSGVCSVACNGQIERTVTSMSGLALMTF